MNSTVVEQRIARSGEEREKAFRLIYESYLRAGLCEENNFGLRISKYQLLPNSEIFVSKIESKVVATVSLVMDGPDGLPMDSIYPTPLENARSQGLRLGEITCLADRRQQHFRIIDNLCALTGLMTQFALKHGLDGFVLISHPKHARFYKRFMAFESIGKVKKHKGVCDKLAEPLWLQFSNVRKAKPEAVNRIFGEEIPPLELDSTTMPPLERECFEQIRFMIENKVSQNSPTSVGKFPGEIHSNPLFSGNNFNPAGVK